MWLKVLEDTGLEDTGLQEMLRESMGQLTVTKALTDTEFKVAFRRLAAFCRSIIEVHADLDQTFLVDNPWSVRYTSIEEILLHIANHGSYRRVNITTMLKQMDEAPIIMDYSLFWYVDMEQGGG